jgi:hypothetical protein
MGYDSKGILVFNLKYEHAITGTCGQDPMKPAPFFFLFPTLIMAHSDQDLQTAYQQKGTGLKRSCYIQIRGQLIGLMNTLSY